MNTNDHEPSQAFQEQFAFLEREVEHQKDQITEIWNELVEAKKLIAQMNQRIQELASQDD